MNETVGESSSDSIVSWGSPCQSTSTGTFLSETGFWGHLLSIFFQQVGMNVDFRETLPYLSVSEVYEDSGGRCLEASDTSLKPVLWLALFNIS